jgi:agmatinase
MLASIGGDHSLSFPVIRAFNQYEPLTIILLDAHLDYRNKSMEMDFSNNRPFRRVRELPFIKRVVTIGVRGIKSTDREYRESLEQGNLVSRWSAFIMQEFRASSKRLGLSKAIT